MCCTWMNEDISLFAAFTLPQQNQRGGSSRSSLKQKVFGNILFFFLPSCSSTHIRVFCVSYAKKKLDLKKRGGGGRSFSLVRSLSFAIATVAM